MSCCFPYFLCFDVYSSHCKATKIHVIHQRKSTRTSELRVESEYVTKYSIISIGLYFKEGKKSALFLIHFLSQYYYRNKKTTRFTKNLWGRQRLSPQFHVDRLRQNINKIVPVSVSMISNKLKPVTDRYKGPFGAIKKVKILKTIQ